MNMKNIILPILTIMISILGCGGGRRSPDGDYFSQEYEPTATLVAIPTAPESLPQNLPDDDDLRALIVYANTMSPLITASGEILQRDGEILKQSEENDQVLCDGRLASDNEILTVYIEQVRSIRAPSDARAIHNLVVESGEAWTEAMAKINEFCATGNALHKIPAALRFWDAAAKLQDAGNRFWLLMMSEGIEAWVQR
ncbi:MAG: hypothetical protein P1P76_08655 [Anaerolineales bacterium]|nr:hypothetical protein [Anaerolineales bacterium]